MTAAYSAFFSSGLLAPYHDFDYTKNNVNSHYDVSAPATPSSPMPVSNDVDTDIEIDQDDTPTPNSASAYGFVRPTYSSVAPAICTVPATPVHKPTLRRRRSSLKVATSPMHAIKSPTRTAEAAMQLQRHLASPLRVRSGSLGSIAGAEVASGNATENNSLVGRMRMRSGSGSVGFRLRRANRRTASAFVPAPSPPPTVPLPALPLFPPAVPAYAPSSFSKRSASNSAVSLKDNKLGRDRSYSVDNGYFIDEEMREN